MRLHHLTMQSLHLTFPNHHHHHYMCGFSLDDPAPYISLTPSILLSSPLLCDFLLILDVEALTRIIRVLAKVNYLLSII